MKLNADIDANGDVVEFEIEHAARRLDLQMLQPEALPLHTVKAN